MAPAPATTPPDPQAEGSDPAAEEKDALSDSMNPREDVNPPPHDNDTHPADNDDIDDIDGAGGAGGAGGDGEDASTENNDNIVLSGPSSMSTMPTAADATRKRSSTSSDHCETHTALEQHDHAHFMGEHDTRFISSTDVIGNPPPAPHVTNGNADKSENVVRARSPDTPMHVPPPRHYRNSYSADEASLRAHFDLKDRSRLSPSQIRQGTQAVDRVMVVEASGDTETENSQGPGSEFPILSQRGVSSFPDLTESTATVYGQTATTSRFDTTTATMTDADEGGSSEDEMFVGMDHRRVQQIRKTLAAADAEDDDDDDDSDEKTNATDLFDYRGMTYRMKKIMRRMQRKQDEDALQEIYTNNRQATREAWRGWSWRYPKNYIRTTNYNLLNFVPKNLFEQFRRVSNIYFLILVIVTQIPGVSPVLPWTAIFPLVFILGVNALKDAYEDWKRYLADRRANGKAVHVIRNGKLKKIKTSDVQMGDMVRIDRDEEVPADIVIISSYRDDGVCYVETANLDGETNLKTKKAVSKYIHHRDIEKLSSFKAKIYVEQPNEDLDRFQGKMVPLVEPSELELVEPEKLETITQTVEKSTDEESPKADSDTPIDEPQASATVETSIPEHEITDGATTPEHVEIQVSSPRSAISQPKSHIRRPKAIGDLIENEKEGMPLLEENLLLRGCVLRNTKFAYGVVVYVGRNTKLFKNLKEKKSKFSFLDKRMNIMLFFLLILQQILCGLFVLLSALFQNQVTSNSYYVQKPGLADFEFVVRDYLSYFILMSTFVPISLFVTLEFVKSFQAGAMERDPMMTHNGVHTMAKTSQLNQELSQIDVILSDKTGTLTENKMEFSKCWVHGLVHDEIKRPGSIGQELSSSEDSPDEQSWISGEQKNFLHHFLKCLVLNHSVIPERDSETNNIIFEGQSADEVALLKAAKRNGYVLLQRTSEGVEVEILGETQYFEVIETIPFSSDRKRMTVFIKTDDNSVIMYTKGADVVMFKRSFNSHVIQQASRALNQFSMEGLRTLVFCYREMTMEEFNLWHRHYENASMSFNNREKKMADVASEIERHMTVIGCTGIEDKLQEGVPEAIEYLVKAGFQLWVLTGDKTQTAVNIAHSANILQIGVTKEIKIRSKSRSECKRKLRRALEYVSARKDDGVPFAIIIDSNSLRYALGKYLKQFVQLVSLCQTCICCRVTPLQKAKITLLVKKHLKRKCLAIGDGANDVSMIQTALVGVGIIGNEGSQASRASDFAIPRFKHLPRLLCVHGRYSTVRNADFLHLSIWKNWILSFVGLLFAFFNGFTAQTLFDSLIMVFYNAVFTALPPFVAGAFEKDLEEDVIMRYPDLYRYYKNDALFNVRTFITWFVMSVYHSCAIFFMYYFLASEGMLGSRFFTNHPLQDGLWSDGSIVIVVVFLVCMLRHSLQTKYFSWAHHLQLWISTISFFGFSFIYSIFPIVFGVSNYYSVPVQVAITIKPYLSIILIVFVTLLPDFLFKYVKRNFFPSNWEKVLLYEKSRKRKREGGEPRKDVEMQDAISSTFLRE